MTEPKWVSIVHAAIIADVSRRTIYAWLEKGYLKFKRNAGGSIRIDKDSLFSDERRLRLPPLRKSSKARMKIIDGEKIPKQDI